jgi:DNA replication protein DnaC
MIFSTKSKTTDMKNASLDLFRQMRLDGMADAYQAVLSLPVNQQPDAHELVARLTDAEQQHRARKRMDMYLKLSKLRYQASLTDIDCSAERGLHKEKLAILADCSWIERGENTLITGATGCGKSFLACALGNHACVNGFRTLYFNMNRLCEQLAVAQAEGSAIKWLNQIQKASLVILDDFGLQPVTHQVKLMLLQILEDRYEKAATLICSQLPVGKWHEYFNEPTIADAILDRLVPRAHRIDLKGKSLRKRPKHLS